MSLDVVVWLSCAVALPQALPDVGAWRYHRISAEEIAGFPKELAARLEGAESWEINRPEYLLRASQASRNPLTAEDLKKLVPQLSVEVIRVEPHATNAGPSTREARRQQALALQARNAPFGVSLVLEGVTGVGTRTQWAVASRVAQACGGAVLQTPWEYEELDAQGRRIE